MQKIGVISDTHGLLRKEAVAVLQDVDMIIHAGDSGGPEILDALSKIAPVRAVRGNCDFGAWASSLPEDLFVETDAGYLYVIHDLFRLNLDAAVAGIKVVVFGHTHVPEFYWKDEVLFLNPGSAGPVRSGRPPTLALIEIEGPDAVFPKIVRL